MAHRYVPRAKHRYVGAYRPKIDAMDKALGRTKFFDDLSVAAAVPRMLHCAILNAPHANGRILSMDSSAAEAMEGVHAVLRYDDPEVLALKPTTHSWTDTAITPYHRETLPRWWDRVVLGDRSRFVGEQMGVAVAAETREIAEEALRRVRVEWETAPAFLETDEAMMEGAAILHPESSPDSNQTPHRLELEAVDESVDDIVLDVGDVEKALAEADAVVETDCTFGGDTVHGTLDFRGVMVRWDEDQMEVWTNHYFSDQVRMHLHEMLGLPLAKIRVHNTNCGAHMGKYNTGENVFFIIAAILSRRARRPVKYKMNVHEEFAESRTAVNFRIRAGAMKDGRITGWIWDGTANNGAYTCVTGYALTAFLCAEGMPRLFSSVESMRISSRVIFTNRLPGGVMRSIGNIQQNWPLSQTVDALAEKLGLDPIVIYKKNFGNPYNPYPNSSVAAVIDAGAREIGWERRHRAGEGEWIDGCKKRGLGMSLHNQWHAEWQENARGRIEVCIRVNPDLSVLLNAPTKETGAGGNSAAVLACAESLSFLGTAPEDIKWIAEGDTDMGLRDVPPTDSVVSFLLSEALVGAAREVKREFLARAALILGLEAASLDMDDGLIFAHGRPDEPLMRAGDLMMDDDCVPITGYNIRDNDKRPTGTGYGAWFAEVEVDTETGEARALHMVIVNDVGQVMHASGAESQQIGGISCIGMGESFSEELCYDRRTGALLNANYLDYRMQTLADSPPVSPILIEEWRGAGEYGACGIAESTTTGVCAAVGNAIYNAVGVRIGRPPFTPRKLLAALAAAKHER
ncbi:MAG: xanthine dehydrogenase family protein molybdopterin-binding subunit [Clostridiales Family XIII bacterium]|jgi:xanthine dehydrogenase molybdenum-binding subunit|nr:xanthine dehydrogenase family protein molybdopterin-binding subunit [Clostridiales Family XIII bacterium]